MPATSNQAAEETPVLTFESRADALSEANILYVAAATGNAWESRERWMYRRVDSYNFHNSISTHCRASIDFIIPDVAPAIRRADGIEYRIVPLMLVRKEEVSIHFDLHDEQGRSVCRLRDEEAARIGGGMLLWLATFITNRRLDKGDDPHSNCFRESLTEIASLKRNSWSEDDWAALKEKACFLSDDERRALFDSEDFNNVVNYLAHSTLLCALVSGRAGDSRILKIGYDTRDTWERAPSVRIGYEALELYFPMVAQDPMTYHIEVDVPDGIDIQQAAVVPKEVARVRERVVDECAHFIIDSCPPGEQLQLCVRMRVARAGWLSEAFVAGLVVAGLLIFTGVAAKYVERSDRPNDPKTDHIFLAGTVFLAVAAALITLLARNEEHQLRAAMLRYLRGILAVQVALAFGAVMALVVTTSPGRVRTVFYCMAVAALACCVPVLLALWRRK